MAPWSIPVTERRTHRLIKTCNRKRLYRTLVVRREMKFMLMPQVQVCVYDTRHDVKLKLRELRVAYGSLLVRYRWNIATFKYIYRRCDRLVAHEIVRLAIAARIRQLASVHYRTTIMLYEAIAPTSSPDRQWLVQLPAYIRFHSCISRCSSRIPCGLHPSFRSFFFIVLFILPRVDFPVRRAAISTHTILTIHEIKRDKDRQTWRVTYGVKYGDKNEKLRCQVIYFYVAADIFTPACPWNSIIHG